MHIIREILNDGGFKKFLSVLLLILLLFSIRSMFNLILFTFIFTFLYSSIINFIYSNVRKILPIKKSVVIILVYLSSIIGLVIAGIKYIPAIGKELVEIWNLISTFKIKDYADKLDPYMVGWIESIKFNEYIGKATKTLMEYVPHIGEFSLNIVVALLLSLFILLEKDEISKFGRKLEKSKVREFYLYYKEFGEKFLNSFGKVLNVQITIAFINAVLSVIMLYFIGFPNVIGLGLMIFILGLIPVAGVVLSFIPLSIIAFSIGGLQKVLLVVALVLILHAFESYVLNPKLMSMKTKLPIFLTFAILMVGEHLMGMWGLLVGLPLFMFFLDIAGVNTTEERK